MSAQPAPDHRRSDVPDVFLRGAYAPPPRTLIERVNFSHNPWFPAELEEQRKYEEANIDPALYRHTWEGEFYEQSEAQVFAGRWRVAEFTPGHDWGVPMFGLDFGFSQDPTAAVKCWAHDGRLYIEADYSKTGLELDDTAGALATAMPGIERHRVIADNARPESISYLKRSGLPMIQACVKGKGSVEDGITYIKSFREVVIHPRAKATAAEFELYSYKVDRQSGRVSPDLIDAYNHCIDALRYALEPSMKKRNSSITSKRLF